MKNIFKVLLCCVLFTSQGALAKLVITDLQPSSEGEIFPKVTYTERPLVSEKINNFLQLTHLEHLANKYKKHPFENVREDENRCCGYTNFEKWHRYKTPKNVLSMSLSGESMGAYPSNFEIYENFDARTGNKFLLSHLVKPDSKTALNGLLVKKIRHRINVFINKTNNSNGKQNSDKQEYVERQIGLYEQCLEDLNDVELDWFRFYIKVDSVIFVKGRCANHAMRALDELDDHHIAVPIKSVMPYLTSYGKNVLSNSN